MRVETLTPVVAAAPGGRARWRLRVENDTPATVGYRLRVIGFDPAHVIQPPPNPPLEAGSSDELDVELMIPEAFAAGHHSIALEVIPDRQGVAPVIAAVTVTVGTIDEVALAVVPSTMRARRRARFKVDIDNRSNTPVELELAGEAPDVEIRMEPDRVVLRPGERVRTSGRVKGPRHLVGDPIQHTLTVAARSRSAPSYAPATFQQRPLFPRGLRTLLGVLLIVGIWGGALGAGYVWWRSREAEPEATAVELVDTDFDGIPETPGDEMIDTDGDGVGDMTAAAVAAAGKPTEPQPGGSDLPTRTSMGGTVKAGDGGQATGVDVTLAPIDLGAPLAPNATPLGFVNGELRATGGAGAGKLWPARFGRYDPVIRSGIRQTESVADVTSTDERGVWFFGTVSIGQSYQVTFSRPGYDTQAFVVTPTADGKPIDLPVELEPATGEVRGTISGPNGALGNVELVLTDGTLVFNSASASSEDVGAFSFTGVSTPGTYTLQATAPGLGTEVVQVTLDAGEQRGGVDIRMRSGVGSIGGRVTEAGQPLGGVTLTASNGDTTVETTSLTEGATGTFLFPRLDVPGRYTITASREGYMTQTRLVNLSANATGVDFDFIKRTGTIIGLAESSSGGALVGANVRVSRDELVFESQTAASPVAGSFTIRDLPPGTYLVELSRYDHEPHSVSVTVGAGQVVDLGRIVLPFRPRADIEQDASLTVRVVDSQAEPLGGATVRIFRNSDDTLVAEQSGAADQTSFVFQPMLIGTYRIEVTKGEIYRLSSRRVSMGLSDHEEVIPLYKLGQVFGTVVDSVTDEVLVDYDIQILRVLPGGTVDPTPVQNIPVRADKPPDPATGQVRWESAPSSLTTGTYEVRVVNPPRGYSVTPDQVLVDGQPPMRFQISPTDDAPIRLRPIEADHFPELSGVVYAPRLGAGNVVSFAPIDAPDLEVELTCPGFDGVPSTLTLTDRIQPPNPTGLEEVSGSGPGFDTYFFGPIALEEADLFGTCTLTVRAPGYVTASVPVLVNPGDGTSNPVLFENVVLFRPEDVGGQVYWVDDGTTPTATERPAPAVNVVTQGPVTIGMTPGTVPVGTAGSDPGLVNAALPALTTDALGTWAYVDPKQVFGEGFYVFTAPGRFEPRSIRLTINETEKLSVGVAPAGSSLVVSRDGTRVQLDPLGGTITTRLDIRTIKGSSRSPTPPDVSGFQAGLTGANAITSPLTRLGTNPLAQGQATTATFTTTDAGTHQWNVTVPGPVDNRARFVPVTAADETASTQFLQAPGTNLAPGAALPQLTKTYVEMGAINVQVVGSNGQPLFTDRPVDGRLTGTLTRTGSAPIPFRVDSANNLVPALPVDLGIGGTGTYQVTLDDHPELAMDDATVQVINENDQEVARCTGASCAAVTVAQGGQPTVRISVPLFGSVIGDVIGVTSATATTGTPLSVGSGLLVQAQLVAVSAGFGSVCVDASGPVITAVPTPDGSYRFFGPEGYYRVTVSQDPEYESIPDEFSAQEPEDVCTDIFGNPDPRFAGPIYHVDNDDPRFLVDDWRLLQRRSAVTINVRNDTALTDDPTSDVGDPVDAADVVVGPVDALPETGTTYRTANGVVTLSGPTDALLPGSYRIEIRKAGYFPVIFNIRIEATGSAVVINVPLPRVGGRIAGVIEGRNTEGDLVTAPTGVVVRDEYTAEDPTVSGATASDIEGQAQPSAVTAAIDPTATPAGTRTQYEITGLGSGAHVLTFAYTDTTPPAYDVVPGEATVTVLGPVLTPADPVVYRAANRRATVTVTSDESLVGAIVRIVDPDDPTATDRQVTVSAENCAAPSTTCTFDFAGLPVEMTSYAVEVRQELHQTATVSFSVPPGNPTTAIPVSVRIEGTVARVTGQMLREQEGGDRSAIPANGQVRLVRIPQAGGPEVTVGTPVPGGADTFSFDVTLTDNYAIEVSAPGYATRRQTFTVVAVDLGRVKPLTTPIIIPELASVTVTVDEPPTPDTITGVALPVGAGAPASIPMTRSGNTFTLAVDPQWTYTFRFTSSGYLPVVVPTPAVQPAIGADLTYPVTMTARSVSGNVTGAGTTSAVTVRLLAGSTVVDGPTSISSTGEFTIDGPVAPGSYTVVAEEFGQGRGTATVPAIADHLAPSPSGVVVPLAARNVAVTFGTSPASANVTITTSAGSTLPAGTGGTPINVPENAFPITFVVTSPGRVGQTGTAALSAVAEATATDRWNRSSLTMSITGINLPVRTISGSVTGTTGASVRAVSTGTTVIGTPATGAGPFTLGGPFDVGTYTLVAEQLGLGRGAVTVDVANQTTPSPTGLAIPLVARPVGVTFSVTPASATVTITGTGITTPITGGSGTPINVPESAFPINYTVEANNRQPVSATGVVLNANEAASPTRWNLTSLTMTIPDITLPQNPPPAGGP